MLNDDELSNILGLIQNCENRERFFGESTKKKDATNDTNSEQIDEDEIEAERVSEYQPEEIDHKKWTDYLNEIAKKMAESFLRD